MRYYEKNVCRDLLKNCPDEIERRDYAEITIEEFRKEYELKNKPVIVKNVTKDWDLERYWTWEVCENGWPINLIASL
jgi:hypothetical protein